MTDMITDKLKLLLGSLLATSLYCSTLASAEDGVNNLANVLLQENFTGDLPVVRQRKILRVLVTYSRTDFAFMEGGKPQGLQADMLREYEKYLNQGIEKEIDKTYIVFIPTTFDRLLTDLEAGKGDVAAALLTITPQRQQRVGFASGGAMNIDEVVVTHKDVTDIESINDLAGREIYILKNSSYAQHLGELNDKLLQAGLEPVKIKEADSHLLSEDILDMVNAGIVPLTVVDDYKAALWSKALPDIRVLNDVKVKTGNTVGWAVRKNNPALNKHLNDFAQTVKKGTLMGNMLFKRYYGNTKWIKNPTAEQERSKFRHYYDLFSRYADQYDFEVLAIAAQAYQESQFDHSLRSHRGAVGIMQLLPSTAADPNVNIPDISGEEDNIHAGVKYLAFLRDRYFSDSGMTEEDRIAFCWAAYNAGPGNVRKMRDMATKMGLDPNVWFGNVEMAAAKIIGRETVHYVRNIFKYYVAYHLAADILEMSREKSANRG